MFVISVHNMFRITWSKSKEPTTYFKQFEAPSLNNRKNIEIKTRDNHVKMNDGSRSLD